ncbi:MAG: tryptophan-rich sensory protein [Oscillospiraceae bacterium]|nr:tryptophan-rich sensory protein [Oscillospiraceae bacterium]
MKKHNISDMLIYIISAEVIGAVSALLSGGFSDFFDKYQEPPLLPPAWLFPVVWTILYAVMGYSAYLIHNSDADPVQKKNSLTIYWVQLALNFSWSIVFFRFEALWAAFAVIMALWVMIIAMIASFRKISPAAAYMNIPYLIWVTFAAYLNLATALINR